MPFIMIKDKNGDEYFVNVKKITYVYKFKIDGEYQYGVSLNDDLVIYLDKQGYDDLMEAMFDIAMWS